MMYFVLLYTPMPRRGEHLSPNVSREVEKPKETVRRFIEFTKNPFAGEVNLDDELEWDLVTDRLYGNEELLRITKNERHYGGVKGLQDSFETAFQRGGLPALKGEFFAQVLRHTEITILEGDIASVFERIIAFK